MELFDKIIQMSHISVIQLLQEKIGGIIQPYEFLSDMSNEELELLRDALVVKYNENLLKKRKKIKL